MREKVLGIPLWYYPRSSRDQIVYSNGGIEESLIKGHFTKVWAGYRTTSKG